MKYKHIQLVSLLIDFLTISPTRFNYSLEEYLLDNGIKYPEKALRELTLEVQERLATFS